MILDIPSPAIITTFDSDDKNCFIVCHFCIDGKQVRLSRKFLGIGKSTISPSINAHERFTSNSSRNKAKKCLYRVSKNIPDRKIGLIEKNQAKIKDRTFQWIIFQKYTKTFTVLPLVLEEGKLQIKVARTRIFFILFF